MWQCAPETCPGSMHRRKTSLLLWAEQRGKRWMWIRNTPGGAAERDRAAQLGLQDHKCQMWWGEAPCSKHCPVDALTPLACSQSSLPSCLDLYLRPSASPKVPTTLGRPRPSPPLYTHPQGWGQGLPFKAARAISYLANQPTQFAHWRGEEDQCCMCGRRSRWKLRGLGEETFYNFNF